jgi:CheY-like chemotaxis protein
MPKRVLIIDDEEDLRTYLQTLLTKAGYETEVAVNGEEGVKAALASRPDLITLDILMPKQSGLKAYQALRESPETKDVPVIVLTGLTQQEDFFGGAVPRPEALIDKPIERESFVKVVSSIIGE